MSATSQSEDPVLLLPEVVAVLLGRHADTLAPSTRQWLERRLDAGDWLWSDVDDVKALLPRCMRGVQL